jgi:hypothetical protein
MRLLEYQPLGFRARSPNPGRDSRRFTAKPNNDRIRVSVRLQDAFDRTNRSVATTFPSSFGTMDEGKALLIEKRMIWETEFWDFPPTSTPQNHLELVMLLS